MAQEIKKQPSTTPAPRQPLDPFAAMRAEMDRVFDSFLQPGLFRAPALARLPGLQMGLPTVDIHETDNEIVFEAELPGMDPKDVDITLRDGVLTFKGEKKSEREEGEGESHLVERQYGSFARSFRLPDTADEDAIKADFDKGVLKVTVPKREDAANAEKKIPVG